jgi:tRNA1Val (adenine37-N6)-methyltransferase
MNRDYFVMEDETLDDLQLNGIFVIQKKAAFRFGVDAVLLANFARIKNGARVIDLCSGTGIVPFIIAGKTKAAHITGLEIQDEMVDMANRTTVYNNLVDRIDFVNGDLKNTELLKTFEKADVVTVNPPYKLQNSGIKNIDDKNAIARHEICCNLEDVIKAAKTVMKDNGRLYMVHRPERLADIMCQMRKYKIEPKLIKMVQPSSKKAPNMVLVEGQNNGGAFLKWEPPLFIYADNGKYSDELNEIYGR